MKKTALIISLILIFILNGCNSNYKKSGIPDFNNQVINEWITIWNNYDLNMVDSLFSKGVSYFSSEKEGIILGLEQVRDHHKSFGFVPGGKKQVNKLWLEDIQTTRFNNTYILTAIWFFEKESDTGTVIQKGPVSFVYVYEEAKFKIAHVNFSNYPED